MATANYCMKLWNKTNLSLWTNVSNLQMINRKSFQGLFVAGVENSRGKRGGAWEGYVCTAASSRLSALASLPSSRTVGTKEIFWNPSVPRHTPSADLLKQCSIGNNIQQVGWELSKKQILCEATESIWPGQRQVRVHQPVHEAQC